MENLIHKTFCRVCRGEKLIKVLDFGFMPLANAFIAKDDLGKPELKFPLAVYFCEDCSLFQLLDVVNPELLFKEYFYLTSASKPLADHFIGLGEEVIRRFALSKNDFIIDIGSNDGVLLAHLKDRCRVLGVEPAENVAVLAEERGVETIREFFNSFVAKKVLDKYGRARIVFATNVFAHVDDLQDFLEGVKILIGKRGIFICEVHWVGNLIGEGGFDQIYHEHLSYFSFTSLKRLVDLLKLNIFDVRLIPIHGGSLQVYIGTKEKVLDSVSDFLNKERELGLDKLETYLAFTKRVEKNRKRLLNQIMNLKRRNKTIVGYGAPAKGNTLLNYCSLDQSKIDYIIDTTPFKQGLYTPGTRIPIYSPEKIYKTKPDYLLLLAWNYADAILVKEKALRDLGIKFIIPVPEVRIV